MDATVNEEHNCDYICEKYNTKDCCDKCPMKNSVNAPLIVAGDDNATNDNIFSLENEIKASAAKSVEEETVAEEPVKVKGPAPKEAIVEDPEHEENSKESAEEDSEQAEKERRLLIHILSQAPSRIKTMLPTDEEEMKTIQSRLVSKFTLSEKPLT